MVQHAAAIDVVEGPEAGAGQVQQRAILEADVVQPPRRGARLRHPLRLGGAIEPGDLPRPPQLLHLLRQHDGAIARPAAGHQRAQGLPGRALAAEDPVIHLPQV